MKKITHILFSGLGGHGSVVFSYLECLKEDEKINHHLIFYGIEEIRNEYINKCTKLGITYSFIKKKKGLDLVSYRNFVRILKSVRPSICLLHSVNLIIPTFYYSLINKIKIIAIEHTPNESKRLSEWMWSYCIMFLASKVVLLTQKYKSELKEELYCFFEDKTALIPNGINIDLFRRGQLVPNQAIKIGMISRLSSTKDHSTLLKAFSILRDKKDNILLMLAGDGETRIDLEKESKELDLNEYISFLGMIKEDAIVDFLNDLDIYVHASLGETLPTAILQAMSMGLPIIASDISGINNLIEHDKTGLLYDSKSHQQLSEFIELLHENKSKRHILGLNARKVIEEKFSNTIMFNKYSQLIKEFR